MKSARVCDYERVYYRSILWTMLCALAVYTHAALNPLLFVFGACGVWIGWWRARHGGAPAQRRVLNVMTALVILAALLYTLRFSLTVESFAFFCILLLILKLFDLRSPRDHGQLIVLSLGFLISAALTSNSMITGIGVFLLALLCARTALLFRLYATSELRDSGGALVGRRGVLDVRAMQIVVGFCCIVLASAVFLVMPRDIGGASLGSWGGASAMQSGFASEVELGRPGRITSSPTPVMRVTVRDRDERALGAPDTPAVYLRGAVLETYSSGRWTASRLAGDDSRRRSRNFDQGSTKPIVPDSDPIAWTHEYEIAMDRVDTEGGSVFAPWVPVELRLLDAGAMVGVDEQTRAMRFLDQGVATYRVRVRDTRLEALGVLGDEPVRAVPEGDEPGVPERVATLARDVLSEAGIEWDPAARAVSEDARAARALETHLRTTLSYTLVSEPVPRGRDATEWFLFERRSGHCEYFASALALMCRAVGIESRVITGYVVAEFNEVAGAYVVRQSNAHAWVEAAVAPGVWRVYDGTPTSDFQQIHEPSRSMFSAITKVYDAIQHEWIRYVVGYDDARRSSLLSWMNPEIGYEDFTERLSNRFAAGRWRLVRSAFFWGGVVFVSSMSIGIGLWYLLRVRGVNAALGRVVSRVLGAFGAGSDRAHDDLARRVDAAFKTLGNPRSGSVPMRTHLLRSGPDAPGADVLGDAIETLNLYGHAPGGRFKDDERTRVFRAAIDRLDAWARHRSG